MNLDDAMGGAQPPPPIDLNAPLPAIELVQDDGAEFDGLGAFDDFNVGQSSDNVCAGANPRTQQA